MAILFVSTFPQFIPHDPVVGDRAVLFDRLAAAGCTSRVTQLFIIDQFDNGLRSLNSLNIRNDELGTAITQTNFNQW
jgi:hypothetical protein